MPGTKDIKDFTKYPSLSEEDLLLGAKISTGGTDAAITVANFKKLVASDVVPQIKEGYWWINGVNTNIVAQGQTPVFRYTSWGLEYKYQYQDDTAYQKLIPFSDLAFTWEDLTPEQKKELEGAQGLSAYQVWLSLEGNAGKSEEDYLTYLRQPATEAAAEVRLAMDGIKTEADAAILSANNAATVANEAAVSANTAAGEATIAAGDANTATELAATAASLANEKAEAANTAAGNADAATKAANNAATLANEKAGLADTAATLADTAKDKAITATANANTAAERANAAAAGAEGLVKGFQSDWNVTNSVDPNYIKNKPEIPTLDTVPSEGTLTYVNTDGTTVRFRIGDEVRVLEDGEYVFYRLYDLADGVASWQESGSGTALPGKVYLQGANYYNKSVRIIKEGVLNEQ